MVLKRESLPIVSEVLALFSRTASWLVLLLAAAGGLLFLLLTHGSAEFSQPYGTLILVKAAAFLLLMGLAGLNRLRLVPLVATGQVGAVRSLQWSVSGEAVILVGVLGATAVLTSFYSPGVP
jgi:putative copper export protein